MKWISSVCTFFVGSTHRLMLANRQFVHHLPNKTPNKTIYGTLSYYKKPYADRVASAY